jgi:hypothetical protein
VTDNCVIYIYIHSGVKYTNVKVTLSSLSVSLVLRREVRRLSSACWCTVSHGAIRRPWLGGGGAKLKKVCKLPKGHTVKRRTKKTTRLQPITYFFSLSGSASQSGLWPPRSRGLLITYNDAPHSVGLLCTSDQLVAETSLPDNTHNRPTTMPPVGFETHDRSRWAAVYRRLRPRGHWDRQPITLLSANSK